MTELDDLSPLPETDDGLQRLARTTVSELDATEALSKVLRAMLAEHEGRILGAEVVIAVRDAMGGEVRISHQSSTAIILNAIETAKRKAGYLDPDLVMQQIYAKIEDFRARQKQATS